nr:MAG TPA: hypothetical protein [Caudoviricetes sp.]
MKCYRPGVLTQVKILQKQIVCMKLTGKVLYVMRVLAIQLRINE